MAQNEIEMYMNGHKFSVPDKKAMLDMLFLAKHRDNIETKPEDKEKVAEAIDKLINGYVSGDKKEAKKYGGELVAEIKGEAQQVEETIQLAKNTTTYDASNNSKIIDKRVDKTSFITASYSTDHAFNQAAETKINTAAITKNKDESPILGIGSRGDEVRDLEIDLHKIDLYKYNHNGKLTDPDGRYGERVEAAVKKLQADVGLRDDGIAGKQTFAALAESVALKDLGKCGVGENISDNKNELNDADKGILSEDLKKAVEALQNIGIGKAALNVTKLGHQLIKHLDDCKDITNDQAFAEPLVNLKLAVESSKKR